MKKMESIMGFHLFGGYGLYVYEVDERHERVRFRYEDENNRPKSPFRYARIQYAPRYGRAYFMSQGRRYYLSDADFVRKDSHDLRWVRGG